jgi:hypothetical protein
LRKILLRRASRLKKPSRKKPSRKEPSPEKPSPEKPSPEEPSPKELWLRGFVLSTGNSLSEKEIHHILHAIGHWIQDKPDTDQNDLLSSIERSRLGSNEPIGDYFDEYELIEKRLELTSRRKALLIIIFRAIQVQVDEQCIQQRRKKPGETRRKVINELVERAWTGLAAHEHERRRAKLTRLCRYGEKWNLIQPASMVLSLRGQSKW